MNDNELHEHKWYKQIANMPNIHLNEAPDTISTRLALDASIVFTYLRKNISSDGISPKQIIDQIVMDYSFHNPADFLWKARCVFIEFMPKDVQDVQKDQ